MKLRKVIDYFVHLQPPASHRACCTIMKRGERTKNAEERTACKEREARKRKKDSYDPLICLVTKRK